MIVCCALTVFYLTSPCNYETATRGVRNKITRISSNFTPSKTEEPKEILYNLMEENNFRDDPTAKCSLGLKILTNYSTFTLLKLKILSIASRWWSMKHKIVKYNRKFSIVCLEYANTKRLPQDHPCVIELIRRSFKEPSPRHTPYKFKFVVSESLETSAGQVQAVTRLLNNQVSVFIQSDCFYLFECWYNSSNRC